MKIRTIIVEDEPLARGRLEALLKADPEIEIVAECGDGAEAVARILELGPDLVFLDVQLPEMDGFEVLAQIGKDKVGAVVFVTAYDRFALKAFEVRAVDYLLKPFDRERFQAALQRAKDYLKQKQPRQPNEQMLEMAAEARPESKYARRLVIKTAGRINLLKLDEVDWIEAADNYINVHVGPVSHLVRETMNSLESRLSPEHFLRISRSCIVNIERVKELQPLFHGTYAVILRDGTRLNMSRGYRDNLSKLMGETGEQPAKRPA